MPLEHVRIVLAHEEAPWRIQRSTPDIRKGSSGNRMRADDRVGDVLEVAAGHQMGVGERLAGW